MKYDPSYDERLTLVRYPDRGQCELVSLPGAGASERVTEAYKGLLITDGNRDGRIFAKASLTVRLTRRTDRKLGESDPDFLCGKESAQRIKATPGITG